MRPATIEELKVYENRKRKLIWILTGIVTALAALMLYFLLFWT